MAVQNKCTRTAPAEQDRLDKEWDERICKVCLNCGDCPYEKTDICCTKPMDFTDEIYDKMREILN